MIFGILSLIGAIGYLVAPAILDVPVFGIIVATLHDFVGGIFNMITGFDRDIIGLIIEIVIVIIAIFFITHD